MFCLIAIYAKVAVHRTRPCYFGIFIPTSLYLLLPSTSLYSFQPDMARSKRPALQSPLPSNDMAYLSPPPQRPADPAHRTETANHPTITPRMAMMAFLSSRSFPSDTDIQENGWNKSLYKAASLSSANPDAINDLCQSGPNEMWYGLCAALKEPSVRSNYRNLYAPFCIPGLGSSPVCFERHPRDRLQDLFVPLPKPTNAHVPPNLAAQAESETFIDKRTTLDATSSPSNAKHVIVTGIKNETTIRNASSVISQKRGPGRPPGSKNRMTLTIRIPAARSTMLNSTPQNVSYLDSRSDTLDVGLDEKSRKASQPITVKRRRRNTDAGDEELEKVLDVKKILDREDYTGRLRRPRGPGPNYADSSLSPPDYSKTSAAAISSKSKEQKLPQSSPEKGKEDIPVDVSSSMVQKRGPGRPRTHSVSCHGPRREEDDEPMLSSDDIPLALMAQFYATEHNEDGSKDDSADDETDSEQETGTSSSLSSPPSPHLSFSTSIDTRIGPTASSSRTTVSASSPTKASSSASLSPDVNTLHINASEGANDAVSIYSGDYGTIAQLESPGSRALKETPIVDLMLLGSSRDESEEEAMPAIDASRYGEHEDMSKMGPSARSDDGSDMEISENESEEEEETSDSMNALGIAFSDS